MAAIQSDGARLHVPAATASSAFFLSIGEDEIQHVWRSVCTSLKVHTDSASFFSEREAWLRGIDSLTTAVTSRAVPQFDDLDKAEGAARVELPQVRYFTERVVTARDFRTLLQGMGAGVKNAPELFAALDYAQRGTLGLSTCFLALHMQSGLERVGPDAFRLPGADVGRLVTSLRLVESLAFWVRVQRTSNQSSTPPHMPGRSATGIGPPRAGPLLPGGGLGAPPVSPPQMGRNESFGSLLALQSGAGSTPAAIPGVPGAASAQQLLAQEAHTLPLAGAEVVHLAWVWIVSVLVTRGLHQTLRPDALRSAWHVWRGVFAAFMRRQCAVAGPAAEASGAATPLPESGKTSATVGALAHALVRALVLSPADMTAIEALRCRIDALEYKTISGAAKAASAVPVTTLRPMPLVPPSVSSMPTASNAAHPARPSLRVEVPHDSGESPVSVSVSVQPPSPSGPRRGGAALAEPGGGDGGGIGGDEGGGAGDSTGGVTGGGAHAPVHLVPFDVGDRRWTREAEAAGTGSSDVGESETDLDIDPNAAIEAIGLWRTRAFVLCLVVFVASTALGAPTWVAVTAAHHFTTYPWPAWAMLDGVAVALVFVRHVRMAIAKAESLSLPHALLALVSYQTDANQRAVLLGVCGVICAIMLPLGWGTRSIAPLYIARAASMPLMLSCLATLRCLLLYRKRLALLAAFGTLAGGLVAQALPLNWLFNVWLPVLHALAGLSGAGVYVFFVTFPSILASLARDNLVNTDIDPCAILFAAVKRTCGTCSGRSVVLVAGAAGVVSGMEEFAIEPDAADRSHFSRPHRISRLLERFMRGGLFGFWLLLPYLVAKSRWGRSPLRGLVVHIAVPMCCAFMCRVLLALYAPGRRRPVPTAMVTCMTTIACIALAFTNTPAGLAVFFLSSGLLLRLPGPLSSVETAALFLGVLASIAGLSSLAQAGIAPQITRTYFAQVVVEVVHGSVHVVSTRPVGPNDV